MLGAGKLFMSQPDKDTVTDTLVVAASDSKNKNRADYICDGTSDEEEINRALNALPSTGGSLSLLDGTFNIVTPIVIPISNVKITGTGRSTILSCGTNSIDIMTLTSLNSVFIYNVCFYGGGSGVASRGINFATPLYVTISGCWVYNLGSDGIYISNGDYCSITDNYLFSNYADSIELDTCENCVVAGNMMFPNSAGTGIYLNATTTTNVAGNVIFDADDGIYVTSNSNQVVGNSIISCDNRGIHVTGDNNEISSNNVFSSGGNDNILITGDTNSITGNYCYGAGKYGIQTSGSENVINGNVCKQNTQHGIYLKGTPGARCVVSNNYCWGNTQNGIYVATSSNNTITGNMCYRNVRHGIYLYNGSDNNTVTGNMCKDNDYSNTATYDGISVYYSDDNIISANRCQDNDRYEINIQESNSNDNEIIGNVCHGTDHTGEINDSGTDTLMVFNGDPAIYMNGSKVFEQQSNGDLKIKGDILTHETF